MSRVIQGLYTDPDGIPLIGSVIVTCLESYSSVLKGTINTFPLVNGNYDFTLNEGKYSFTIELTAAKPSTKIYLGNGVVTTGDTALNIATIISVSTVAPPSIKQVFNSLDTIVDSVKADTVTTPVNEPSDIDYSITNIITTSDNTVDINQLGVSYGGSWEFVGNQTVGTKTIYFFERVSPETTYTIFIDNVGII